MNMFQKEINELESMYKWIVGGAVLAGGVGIASLVNHPEILSSVVDWHSIKDYVKTTSAVAGVTAVGGLMVGTGAFAGMQYRYRKLATENYCYFRVIPHIHTHCEKQKILEMIDQFAVMDRPRKERFKQGREWFRLLIHSNEYGQISFYIGFSQDRETGVKQAIKTCYRNCEIHSIIPSEVPLPQKQEGYGGQLVLSKKRNEAGHPLKPFNGQDQLSSVLYSMSPDSWIDLVFSPVTSSKLTHQIEKTKKYVLTQGGKLKKPLSKTDLPPKEKQIVDDLEQRFTGFQKGFEVFGAIWTLRKTGGVAQTIANKVSTMMRRLNNLHLELQDKCPSQLSKSVPYPIPHFNQGMLWTDKELAQFVHLPPGPDSRKEKKEDNTEHIYDRIIHLEKGQRSLKDNELAEGVKVAKLLHPLQIDRWIKIPIEQFKKHFVLSGITGSGKSSTSLTIFRALIDDWLENPKKEPGFTYIDPSEETVLAILTYLLAKEKQGHKVPWEKVHFIQLHEPEYPIGLNILKKQPGLSSEITLNLAKKLVKYAYGNKDTPSLDRFLESALSTLINHKEEHSLASLYQLFMDEEFRNRVVPQVSDEFLQGFWEQEGDNDFKRDIRPLLNRLNSLLLNKHLRRMFGQKQWGLDILKWMDEGHIVLIDALGMDKRDFFLAGGTIVEYYYEIAKQFRGTGSKLHILAIDESHLLKLPIYPEIIAFARKHGLSLGLITQYFEQFKGEQDILKAMKAVGNVLCCTQEAESAELMSKVMNDKFDPEFLKKLPDLTTVVYTRTKEKDLTTEKKHMRSITCLGNPEPPYLYLPEGRPANHEDQAEIIRAKEWAMEKALELQKRDGRPVEEIDAEISEILNPSTITEVEQPETSENEDHEPGVDDGWY
jgi:hypothetical protein